MHSLSRRRALLLAGSAGTLLAAPHTARASGWPSRPVRIIAPFPPGTATDIWARAIATPLSEALGQSVVVENRTGASGQIGTEAVAKAGDGHTLLIGTPVNSIGVRLFRGRLPYDFQRDFTPVVLLAVYPLVCVAAPSLPANTLPELAALARRRPGEITYASSGAGSSAHLAGELLEMVAGVDMTHVPYRGTAAAHADLMAGRVSILFDNVLAAGGALADGRLKALAIASERRTPALPNVPTSAEQGFPDLIASSWTSVLVPRGTPEEAVPRLNGAINRLFANSDFTGRFTQQGAEIGGGEPDRLRAFIEADIARWTRVIEAANIQPDA